MAYTSPLITRNEATGRMETRLPAGTYSEANVRLTATGQVHSLAGPLTASADNGLLWNVRFAGDSNTVGVGAADAATQSYPARLGTLLDPARYDVSEMGLNQPQMAVGGQTTQDILRNITTDYFGNGTALSQSFKANQNNALVAMVTTNDIGRDTPGEPYMDGDGTSAYPGVRANLASLAAACRAAGYTRLLVIIPPEHSHNPGNADNVWSYPKQPVLRDWMLANYQAAGWDMVLDLYPDPFIGQYRTDNAQYWAEPLHLSALGLQRLATLIKPKLDELTS